MNTKLMRDASYLLPPPGGDVVRGCLDEIERLKAALEEIVEAHDKGVRTDTRYAALMIVREIATKALTGKEE